MNVGRALESWQYWGHPGRHAIQATALGVYLKALFIPDVLVGKIIPHSVGQLGDSYLQKSRHQELGKIYRKFANKESCICSSLPNKPCKSVG
jgi:hypothetical protein